MSKKKTPESILRDTAERLLALLTPDGGVDLLALEEVELLRLLVNVQRNLPQLLDTGLTRFRERKYTDLTTLALDHMAHRQWHQAKTAARRAAEIKPHGRKAGALIRLSDALEHTLELLSTKKVSEAQKRFADAGKCGLVKLPVVYRVIAQEVDAAVSASQTFDQALAAARSAIAPDDQQDFALARNHAQTALETGWNDRLVQDMIWVIDQTEAAVITVRARHLIPDDLTTAQQLISRALELVPGLEVALSLQAAISDERAINQFAVQLRARLHEGKFSVARAILADIVRINAHHSLVGTLTSEIELRALELTPKLIRTMLPVGSAVSGGDEIFVEYQTVPQTQIVLTAFIGVNATEPIIQNSDAEGRVAFTLTAPDATHEDQTLLLAVQVVGMQETLNREAVFIVQAVPQTPNSDTRSVPELIAAAEQLMQSDPTEALRLVMLALTMQPNEPTLEHMKSKLEAAVQTVDDEAPTKLPLALGTREITVTRGQIDKDGYRLDISGGAAPYSIAMGMGATWITVNGSLLMVKTPNPQVSKGTRELVITDSAGEIVRATCTVHVQRPAAE